MPTLLLICNEASVWQKANNYMKSRPLAGQYEPVEVEGASIGLVADQYKAMREAFWEKLMAAAAFQQTRRLIALNHRGCAAMKIAYGLNKSSDKLIETEQIDVGFVIVPHELSSTHTLHGSYRPFAYRLTTELTFHPSQAFYSAAGPCLCLYLQSTLLSVNHAAAKSHLSAFPQSRRYGF